MGRIQTVDVWSAIDEEVRYKQRYSPREIEVLQAVDHFRRRCFLGSGKWEIKEFATFAGANKLHSPNDRALVYAGSTFPDGPRYASLPRVLTSNLLLQLHRVGPVFRPRLKRKEYDDE